MTTPQRKVNRAERHNRYRRTRPSEAGGGAAAQQLIVHLSLSLGSMAEIIPASFSAAPESKAVSSSGARKTTGSHLMRQTVQTHYLHYTHNFFHPLFLPPRALFIARHERTFLGVVDVRGNWAFHVEQGPDPAVSLGTPSEHQVG